MKKTQTKSKASKSSKKTKSKSKAKKMENGSKASSEIKKDSNLYLKYDPQEDSSAAESNNQVNTKTADIVTWIKNNPGKSVAMGLLGAFALKAQATRKLLFWTATTAGTMIFQKEAQEVLEKSLYPSQKSVNSSETENLSTPSIH